MLLGALEVQGTAEETRGSPDIPDIREAYLGI
jgi:hypothetical protein